MADYAANYTPRYRVRYKVGGKNHSWTWRFSRGSILSDVQGDAVARANVFLNALTPLRYSSFAILGADFAYTDSDVFLPCAAPTPAAGAASEIGSSVNKMITQYRFEARAVTGSRYNFLLFGLSIDQDDSPLQDYRISGTEVPELSSARSALSELGSEPLVAISGASLVWKPYVNVKTNDHWRRRAMMG